MAIDTDSGRTIAGYAGGTPPSVYRGAVVFTLSHALCRWRDFLLIATTDPVSDNRWVFVAIGASMTVALSHSGAALLHRYVEMPGTRYGKRIAKRRENGYRRSGPGYAHGLRQLAQARLGRRAMPMRVRRPVRSSWAKRAELDSRPAPTRWITAPSDHHALQVARPSR